LTQQSTTLADSPAAARRVPATRKEEALWLLESVVPGSAPNNLSLAFQADGRIRHDAAERALHVMLRRHEVLRTVYFAEGTELTSAVLAREDCAVEVSRGDISDMAELTDFVARPFALDGTPLLRAGVFRYGDTDVFCLAVHHLIFDTLSSPTLLKEFVAAYEHLTGGRELPDDLTGTVPALAHRAPTPESVAYWRAQLAGFDPDGLALRCGTDVAEPTLAGDYLLRDLSPGTTAVVRRLRKELRAPEAVILLAAYYQLLAAHGAGPDVVVGSPVDTRPAGRQDAVGYHVNVVPLRVRVDPALTFRQLVREAREVFFDSLLRADVPVDDLSAELPRQGSTWRNLLFRHLFNYVSELGLEQFTLAGMPARPLIVENGCSKFDLELFVLSSKERIRVRAVYGTEFFERDEVTSLLSRYERLLLTLGAEPDRPLGEFRVWSEQDEAVIDAANATRKDGLPLSQLTVLRERCLSAPDTVAVIDGDDRVTHRGLWHAADAVRRLLTDHGVRRGDVVALAGRRSAALVAGVLGTWLAGAAYLPVEPGHPASRIALQLSDSGARVVLADDPGSVPTGDDPDRVVLPLEEAVASAGRAEPHGPPVECTPPDPEDAAYLIYTSGSTGTPKGTRISHRSLANLVAHFTSAVDPSPQDGVLWLTTFAFDISALELFVPLAAGSPVVEAPDEARIRGEVLRDLLDRHPVRDVQATPTTWQQVLEHVEDRLAGRTVLCGGEPAPLPLMRRLATAG
jgi:non-ribosomal peptide synthetase component F